MEDFPKYQIEKSGTTSAKAPAHKHRRRRRITQELFRCQLPDTQNIGCGALLWREDNDALRRHLIAHHNGTPQAIAALPDSEIQACFSDAKRIPMEGIPDSDEE